MASKVGDSRKSYHINPVLAAWAHDIGSKRGELTKDREKHRDGENEDQMSFTSQCDPPNSESHKRHQILEDGEHSNHEVPTKSEPDFIQEIKLGGIGEHDHGLENKEDKQQIVDTKEIGTIGRDDSENPFNTGDHVYNIQESIDYWQQLQSCIQIGHTSVSFYVLHIQDYIEHGKDISTVDEIDVIYPR
jgi:hypothetical protein